MTKKLSLYVCALSLLLFIALTVFVSAGNAGTFNNSIHGYVVLWRNTPLTNVMTFLDIAGALYVYIPVIVVLLIMPQTRKKVGIPVGIIILFSEMLNRILKIIFAIPRPDVDSLVTASGYGHPSGHAMNALVFAGACAILFLSGNYKRPLKIIIVALSIAYILFMGFSRIYLGVHTATDVIAGYSAGAFILCISYYLWQDDST